MARVLITGSGGVLGTILREGLPHDTTDYDLPNHDVKDFTQLREIAKGHKAIVHLAWNTKEDNWLTENLDPENLQANFNVFEAAILASVPRVIVASTVHADKFAGRKVDGLLQPYALPVPDSPYGANKCGMEALGRYYADAKGLEVICIRFGAINPDDTPPEQLSSERRVWLSHRDCLSLIVACLESPAVPGNYAIVYAVSNNKDRLHDTTNPFGWTPLDGAA